MSADPTARAVRALKREAFRLRDAGGNPLTVAWCFLLWVVRGMETDA